MGCLHPAFALADQGKCKSRDLAVSGVDSVGGWTRSEPAGACGACPCAQGLDDHVHIPTLRAFPKHVPVVANPSAAERVRPLGFKDVRVLDHGQR